jgi:hypothetical protein
MWKSDIGPRPRIGPPFWVHPIQRAHTMSDRAFFDKKIHTTKLAQSLGVKGLGLISAF